MRFLPVNLSSFLIELASCEETIALYNTLSSALPDGIEEMLPAARTLLIRYRQPELRSQLIGEISRCPIKHEFAVRTRRITIPVRYDGEDLSSTAEFYGISIQQLIDRHQQSLWKVAFIGFSPGFAYMVSSGASWNTPRHATPRTRIPAGSVALAGEFSGIYPQASPGGWQLIGHTELTMWDMARQCPALLLPGDEVAFIEEKHAQRQIFIPPVIKHPLPPQQSEDLLSILAPGLQTTWQDAGRPGYAAMGISPAGAMDKTALRQANRLVGNPVDTPCLEITMGGFHALAHKDMVIAVTGAPCLIYLKTRVRQYPLNFGTACSLAPGDEVIINTPHRGVRSYLAIRGGGDAEQTLGSASFDSLAKIGVSPLQAGHTIKITQPVKTLAVQPEMNPLQELPAKDEIVTLDMIAGPRTDWFTPCALDILTRQKWQVTTQSNRIGLRLHGQHPLERIHHQELPSEGVCTGALQVPASGQPILFLNDHPLTGGYPVIGAIAHYHLDLAGQIPPGAWIRFNIICPFQTL